MGGHSRPHLVPRSIASPAFLLAGGYATPKSPTCCRGLAQAPRADAGARCGANPTRGVGRRGRPLRCSGWRPDAAKSHPAPLRWGDFAGSGASDGDDQHRPNCIHALRASLPLPTAATRPSRLCFHCGGHGSTHTQRQALRPWVGRGAPPLTPPPQTPREEGCRALSVPQPRASAAALCSQRPGRCSSRRTCGRCPRSSRTRTTGENSSSWPAGAPRPGVGAAGQGLTQAASGAEFAGSTRIFARSRFAGSFSHTRFLSLYNNELESLKVGARPGSRPMWPG